MALFLPNPRVINTINKSAFREQGEEPPRQTYYTDSIIQYSSEDGGREERWSEQNNHSVMHLEHTEKRLCETLG